MVGDFNIALNPAWGGGRGGWHEFYIDGWCIWHFAVSENIHTSPMKGYWKF